MIAHAHQGNQRQARTASGPAGNRRPRGRAQEGKRGEREAATIPTADELETIETQVMEARDMLEQLTWRLAAYAAGAAQAAPTFADLGALWGAARPCGGRGWLAIAAAAETVPLRLAAGGGDGCDAGEAGEGGFGADATAM